MTRVVFLLWALLVVAGGVLPGIIEAQSVPQDTVKSEQDSSGQEIVLDVIYIKGSVEKPGVIIVPKRIGPELKEVELDRSFKREVNEGIGEVPKPEKETGKVERVKSIKKTVERKRR